jgi:hypothetical protein
MQFLDVMYFRGGRLQGFSNTNLEIIKANDFSTKNGENKPGEWAHGTSSKTCREDKMGI